MKKLKLGPTIKEAVDRKDKKTLMYQWVNALDVDPTFEEYRDDWTYMKKNFPEVFDEHKELSQPLTTDRSKWNEKYWAGLGYDLLKNFSEKRFQHMREVAKVFLADKIERLKKESAEAENKGKNKSSESQSKPKLKTDPAVRTARKQIIEAIVDLSNGKIDHKQFAGIKKKCEDEAKSGLYVENDGKSLGYDSSISYTRGYLNNAIDRCLYCFSKKDVDIAASIALDIRNNEHKQETSKETPSSEKDNPTHFQRIKASLISIFAKLVNSITNMVKKMKDGRVKRFLLGLLRRAKTGLAKSKSLQAAKPQMAKQLSDSAKEIQEKLNQMQKAQEGFTCEGYLSMEYEIAEEGIFSNFFKKRSPETNREQSIAAVKKNQAPPVKMLENMSSEEIRELDAFKECFGRLAVKAFKDYVRKNLDKKYQHSIYSYKKCCKIDTYEEYGFAGIEFGTQQDGIDWDSVDKWEKTHKGENYEDYPEFDSGWYWDLWENGMTIARDVFNKMSDHEKYYIDINNGDGDEGVIYTDIYIPA